MALSQLSLTARPIKIRLLNINIFSISQRGKMLSAVLANAAEPDPPDPFNFPGSIFSVIFKGLVPDR